MYPGIDLIYSIKPGRRGVECCFQINPEADATLIRAKFGGDMKFIEKESSNGILINTDLSGILQSAVVTANGIASNPMAFNVSNPPNNWTGLLALRGKTQQTGRVV